MVTAEAHGHYPRPLEAAVWWHPFPGQVMVQTLVSLGRTGTESGSYRGEFDTGWPA